MALRCDRCGQAILEGDNECWRCGARLQIPPKPTAALPAHSLGKNHTADEPSVSLSAIGYYAATTAVILLLLVWLLHSLAQKPLILVNPDISRPRSWTAVTAPGYQYTINLPSTWLWATTDDPQLSGAFTDMLNLPAAQAVMASWTPIADNIQPKLLASNTPDSQIFLLIAAGPAVPSAALQDAVQAQLDGRRPNLTQSFLGHDQLSFYRNYEINGRVWRCHAQVHGAPINYWLTICGPTEEIATFTYEMALIFGSFQPLAP